MHRSIPGESASPMHCARAVARRGAFLSLALAALLAGCSAQFQLTQPQPKQSIPEPPASPPTTATQSGSVAISPQYVALAPGQTYQFNATVAGSGQTEWFVNGVQGGNATTGTISATGSYTAPATVAQSENVVIMVALSGSAQQNYATAVVSIIQPAVVTCPFQLGSPLVAQYSLYLPAPGKMSVEFGTTTSYGRETWQVPTPSANGGDVQIYVAGMLAQTLYHMRAQVTLANGATYDDADHQCSTAALTASISPVSAAPIGGATPQSGIEMWNTLVPPGDTQAFATDLHGNVIWTYAYADQTANDYLQGIQLLPNGNLLTLISYLSSMNPVTLPSGTFNEIREIDLAGHTIESLTMDQLNQKLAAGNWRDQAGNLMQLGSFHHDVLALPNGHFVLLTTYIRNLSGLTGVTGTVPVIGDALVDVDQNFTPDWVWSAFDHLDVNRHPMNFGVTSNNVTIYDWTHSNDMLYSSDDGNLLLSMRHQNWIIKIDFEDGAGTGDVFWRLGYQGDFKLEGATDPTDWFYAQHGMNFFSSNTAGVFSIGMMDNGNDRTFPSGPVYCIPHAPSTPSCYSTMPILEVNESTKTATMIQHYSPGDTYFSFFGGNADLLANGDYEVDFCAPVKGAIVQELDPQSMNVVWQGTTQNGHGGADQYHAYRMPSLYPGVQW